MWFQFMLDIQKLRIHNIKDDNEHSFHVTNVLPCKHQLFGLLGIQYMLCIC